MFMHYDPEIDAQLKKLQEPKWLETRLKRLSRWPEKKQETIKKLLKSPVHAWDRDVWTKRITTTASLFEGLTDTQRRDLWKQLYPKLASHMERAWQDAAAEPYQNTDERFPFRAPDNPEAVKVNRARFFLAMIRLLQGLDQDVMWLAEWGDRLPSDGRAVGAVLAAALRAGGADAEGVREILIDSINGRHATARMGPHTIVALLNSPERADWEAVGKLLLAAQRQEGVRQAILESVDEANPEAFRYMLGLILEHDLARFSATVRAFDVWLGMQWEGGSVKVVNEGIRRLIEFFDDPAAAERAVREGEPEEAYFALWTIAFGDAMRALALAAPMLDEPSPERRFVGLKMLESLVMHPAALEPVAARLISGVETDERMIAAMLDALSYPVYKRVPEDLFEAVAGLYQRLPARGRKQKPIVWPWCEYTLSKRNAADALQSLARAEPARMMPYAGALDSWRCAGLVRDLVWGNSYWRGKKRRKITPETRALLLDLIVDSRADVYEVVFEALAAEPLEPDEVERICGQLHRTAAKFRRAAIDRLTKLEPRKREDIATLRGRVTDLRRQTLRMRLSLETAMCRGDTFTGPELAELWGHPLLRPMLLRLVWLGEGELAGYPIEGARALQDHSGRIEPIGKRDTLRLAHPVDLLARGDWSDWQRECFAAERVQPFKQVFREVYPKTATELDQADSTRRYAGHQVNPRQALALLKQRQWVIAPEEGVRRTWHDEGIIAGLWFAEHFFTPADVDGLTLEAVSFQKRSKARGLLHIADVPDRVFSETMRDLDLVVSVAHAGGVDPEATASTVEMRAALLGQTCQLLGLNNVRIDGTHAMIDGSLASYTLHLGSAITHVAPGRALPIIAVHSQYRGPLFLPFADSDPRTAEVMAKALLLARDDEIRDPKILGWIRG